MNRVAKHLEMHSIGLKDAVDIDLFGRSAFNRFYYSAYWTVRDSLSPIRPSISKQPHKNMPIYLKNSFKNYLLKKCTVLESKKIIKPSESKRIQSIIRSQLMSISSSLENAYYVRCIADYYLEEKAILIGNKIRLGGMSSSDVSSIDTKVKSATDTLVKTCHENGLYQ